MITPKTIILPVDFSTRAAGAAAHARILAKQFGAKIVALHVMRPFQLAAEGVDVPSAAVLDWYSEQRPLLETQLADFAKLYLTGCDVKTVFCEGEPASEVIRVAREEHGDLIMISTHGYGPFRRFLLGSVSDHLVHHAGCPVLVVRLGEHEFV